MALPTSGLGTFIDYRGGDVVIHLESLQRNVVGTTLTGPAGNISAYFQIAGYPVKTITGTTGLYTCTPILNGDEASTTGILIHGALINSLTAAAITGRESLYLLINDFTGVVINQSALPVLDCQGAALVPATIGTALAALTPAAKVTIEPSKITEQVGGTAT